MDKPSGYASEMPHAFEARYEDFLTDFAEKQTETYDYSEAWFYVYEEAREALGREAPEEYMLVDLEVVPYTVEGSSAFAVALVPTYTCDKEGEVHKDEPVLLHVSSRNGAHYFEESAEEGIFVVPISHDMGQHLIELMDAYVEAINRDTVIPAKYKGL